MHLLISQQHLGFDDRALARLDKTLSEMEAADRELDSFLKTVEKVAGIIVRICTVAAPISLFLLCACVDDVWPMEGMDSPLIFALLVGAVVFSSIPLIVFVIVKLIDRYLLRDILS